GRVRRRYTHAEPQQLGDLDALHTQRLELGGERRDLRGELVALGSARCDLLVVRLDGLLQQLGRGAHPSPSVVVVWRVCSPRRTAVRATATAPGSSSPSSARPAMRSTSYSDRAAASVRWAAIWRALSGST